MTTDQNTTPDVQSPAPETAPTLDAARPAHADVVKAARDAVADKARAEYLVQTAESRKGQADDEKRYAAYDRTYLRFIDGTISSTTKGAKAAAKDLGHEGDHIETRPV